MLGSDKYTKKIKQREKIGSVRKNGVQFWMGKLEKCITKKVTFV